MKKVVLFIPLILFMVMGAFLYKGLFLNPEKLDSALQGKAIPEFQLQQLENPEKIITNNDLIGKVSLLNVWGTWCPSCKHEHPYLMQLAQQNILPIYGINYRDERTAAVSELATMGDPYTLNIYDKDGKLGLDLGVYGAPETFLVDQHGVIRYRYAGPLDMRVWHDILLPKVQMLEKEALAAKAKEEA